MTDESISIDTGTDELLCAIRDRVAVITLNRPGARNSLSDHLTPALRRMIKQSGDDPDVGALLITGAGTAFCSGGDVKGMGGNSAAPAMSFDDKVALLRERNSATLSSNDMAGAAELPPIPLTSPPEQKAVPAPVISNAPTSGSSPLCLIIRRNAGVRWSDSELRAPGRFKVITATRSRIAHSSSSVPVSIEIDSSVMVLTFQVRR